MFRRLEAALRSIQQRDPAARSLWEIALLYPGVRALAFHRLAHALWQARLRFLGRLVSELGRWLSGIEIHPGATIGRWLFIDHGTGVVIGETAVVGDDVTLYHGVTLGGIAASGHQSGRRHPVVEDGVIVGAGAQVLGAITVGRGARVGANAVVLKDVPAGATVVGIPAQVAVARPATTPDFAAYGTCEDLPDPTAKAIAALMAEIHRLERRLAAVEGDRTETTPAGARTERTAAFGPEG
jgi:serine O-acetyltransferase